MHHAHSITLAEAEGVIAAAGELMYRRALTPIEQQFGDVPRVRADFERAEIAVATAAKPILQRIVAQMVYEVRPLILSGDLTGIARIRPSYVPELAAAIFRVANSAKLAGARQVRESIAAQGRSLARKPKRKTPALIVPYLEDRSGQIAEQVAAQQQAAIAAVAARRVIAGAAEWDDESMAVVEAAMGRGLVAVGTSLGRESYGLGRMVELTEIAQSGMVGYGVYTAVLDDAVCDVCAGEDGRELALDELDAAPNDECLGGDRCRCYVIAVMH